MLCYLRALLFKNSWYHYVILQRWGNPNLNRIASSRSETTPGGLLTNASRDVALLEVPSGKRRPGED